MTRMLLPGSGSRCYSKHNLKTRVLTTKHHICTQIRKHQDSGSHCLAKDSSSWGLTFSRTDHLPSSQNCLPSPLCIPTEELNPHSLGWLRLSPGLSGDPTLSQAVSTWWLPGPWLHPEVTVYSSGGPVTDPRWLIGFFVGFLNLKRRNVLYLVVVRRGRSTDGQSLSSPQEGTGRWPARRAERPVLMSPGFPKLSCLLLMLAWPRHAHFSCSPEEEENQSINQSTNQPINQPEKNKTT